jgi:hypothetical protein
LVLAMLEPFPSTSLKGSFLRVAVVGDFYPFLRNITVLYDALIKIS